MNIGSAAERSGVPRKTIRYYESIGLIAAADRRANNYRDYSESDVQTLRFIHRARSLGFSVREVAGLLALWRDRRRASHDVKALAVAHVHDIDRKVAELQSMRRTLTELTERCHGDQRPECPILDDLAGGDVPERRRDQAAAANHRQAGAGR
ncbi:MAG TPA: Cu(I)-responsive transcriptional regulator [Alphaproteobacteria bacterium]|nr:Cu(I)-responsive transcriptional regulator [Alphaproteobacteria bacterium]